MSHFLACSAALGKLFCVLHMTIYGVAELDVVQCQLTQKNSFFGLHKCLNDTKLQSEIPIPIELKLSTEFHLNWNKSLRVIVSQTF